MVQELCQNASTNLEQKFASITCDLSVAEVAYMFCIYSYVASPNPSQECETMQWYKNSVRRQAQI